jgi:Zn-finger nucleic acid-binding protein
MARCQSCSAPLLANTNRCQYCGVRNDVDLQAKHDVIGQKKTSDRLCPHCARPLQTIQLQLDTRLSIERCINCFGLFFDLGELEALLNHSVSHVQSINLAHLDNINTDRYRTKQIVKYIKCPVCLEFMRRTNFAQKSGVIVDSCRLHGLWLDSGEVTHLLEWKKAGGQLLHEQELKNKAQKTRKTPVAQSDRLWGSSEYQNSIGLETDLLELLASVVQKIF